MAGCPVVGAALAVLGCFGLDAVFVLAIFPGVGEACDLGKGPAGGCEMGLEA